MKPRLGFTMGDVNGIGPEILAKALHNPCVWACCDPIVVGNAGVLKAACDQLVARDGAAKARLTLRVVDEADICEGPIAGEAVVPVLEGQIAPPEIRPGHLDARAGRCAVEWLRAGVRLAMSGALGGIVTCPLNKEGIHLAGFDYPGHTEIIAEMTGVKDYRMSLFAGSMRIVHVTAHLPLAEVVRRIRPEPVAETIRIADQALERLSLGRRRIGVAGLNPHAGEHGVLGTEEAEQIRPAVESCRAEGIDCSGPYPPDTVFRRLRAGEFDLVVAMYHDQGHIALKLIAMDEGVNVTLGVPIVRTSVDHGTAYDIAGRGIACEKSLLAAAALAAELAGDSSDG